MSQHFQSALAVVLLAVRGHVAAALANRVNEAGLSAAVSLLTARALFLAMQKVVGSSPIIRSQNPPHLAGFSSPQ